MTNKKCCKISIDDTSTEHKKKSERSVWKIVWELERSPIFRFSFVVHSTKSPEKKPTTTTTMRCRRSFPHFRVFHLFFHPRLPAPHSSGTSCFLPSATVFLLSACRRCRRLCEWKIVVVWRVQRVKGTTGFIRSREFSQIRRVCAPKIDNIRPLKPLSSARNLDVFCEYF